MNSTLARMGAALGCLLVFASCATLQRISDEKGAAWVARLVNEGRADELAAASSSPFLLDGEIIALSEDTAAFWNGVAKAGVTIEPQPSRVVAIGPDSWREFAATREVRVFFEKYVAEGARLYELRTSGGRRVLVLCRSSGGTRRLFGFKGPF